LPLPKRDYVFAVSAFEGEHQFEECTVERCPVILCEFDKPRLNYKAAEFDQMPGSFAPLHDPIPRINSCLLRFETA